MKSAHKILTGSILAAAVATSLARQGVVAADAEVQVAAGRVRINANTAPLSAVLDRVSKTTGMKVVYEGAPPTDRVTVAIDAPSETEALSRLLEGLGLTHAFKLDASGKHVETLLITTLPSSSSRRASSSTSSSSRTARAPEPIEDVNEEPMIGDVAEDSPDPAAPEMQGNMGGGMVGGGLAPGMAPDNSQTPEPAFPGAASYPSTPGINPTFPGNPITFPPAPTPPNPYSFPTRQP